MRYLLFCIFIIGFFACEKTNTANTKNCAFFSTAIVTAADAPASTSVGTNIPLKAYFNGTDGCYSFSHFDVQMINSTTTRITVQAKSLGCICTQAITNLSATYIWQATKPGNYTIEFVSGNNFITKNIVVN
jgi:hypothetical protein